MYQALQQLLLMQQVLCNSTIRININFLSENLCKVQNKYIYLPILHCTCLIIFAPKVRNNFHESKLCNITYIPTLFLSSDHSILFIVSSFN